MSAAELRRAAAHIRGDGSPYELGEAAVHALAAWLDTTAKEIEAFARDWAGVERAGDLTETDDAALTFARTVLPEDGAR